MKKQLLTLALFAAAQLTFGQFTITPTSISFTGNTVPEATEKGQFYLFQPNNDGGAMFSDNNCNTPLTQGDGADELGGFAPTVYGTDAPDNPFGISYFGGKIRTVFYGSPCAANSPSLGFTTGTSTGLASGTNVDLSATANQKVKFTYVLSTADVDMTFTLQLFDAVYNAKLNKGTTVTLVADAKPHTVTLDFSGDIAPDAVLTDVRQVSLIYTSTTLSPNFGITLTDIAVGSAVTTGVNAASANVSLSKVYPNPATESATVELNLASNANVKVVMNDLVGKQVKVIAEGNYSNLQKAFSVSELSKGMYTITYLVDGVPAKTESLIVR